MGVPWLGMGGGGGGACVPLAILPSTSQQDRQVGLCSESQGWRGIQSVTAYAIGAAQRTIEAKGLPAHRWEQAA
jgi:hypothetical protein